MSLGRYAIVVGAVVLATLAAVALAGASQEAFAAAALGALLAAGNTLVAYGLALWSADRRLTVVMGTVLGGMLGRMVVMLSAAVAALVWLRVAQVPFVSALLGHFLVFLVFEIAVLWRRAPQPREA